MNSILDKIIFGLGSIHHISRSNGIKILNSVYDLGVKSFDTADLYGYGYSNKILSDWIHQRKVNDITIIHKSGLFNSINCECRYKSILYVVKILKKIGLVNDIPVGYFKLKTNFGKNKVISLYHEPNHQRKKYKKELFDGVAGYNLADISDCTFFQGHIDDNNLKINSKFGVMSKFHFNIKLFVQYVKENNFMVLYTSNDLSHILKLKKEIFKNK